MSFNDTRTGDAAVYARKRGFSGTLTFGFGKVSGNPVQGRVAAGAPPLEAFEARLKQMLEKKN